MTASPSLHAARVQLVRTALLLLRSEREVSAPRGGELRPDGARQMRWYSYDPALMSGMDAAVELTRGDPDYLANFPAVKDVSPSSASLEELGTRFTYIIRGERFFDGHIDTYVKSGELQLLFERLLELVPDGI
ncbi:MULTISPECIES: DUF6508 domain-containing protein [Arthrobacter]|uniref:DUF6508 domain-containing protein n=2 Tax=Arthrobacter TaxID=1663 RepID=A0ABU9KFB4_9MICC|nr:DUF6508 domain-containing protein [Arthrobacter sp. YJM1]MDP5225559.1 DUF6508 domain-containing protein [Arthrobacter sp. YJM1]